MFGEQSEQAEADNSLDQKPQCDANFHAEEAEGETQDPPSQPEDGAPALSDMLLYEHDEHHEKHAKRKHKANHKGSRLSLHVTYDDSPRLGSSVVGDSSRLLGMVWVYFDWSCSTRLHW